MMFDVNIDKLVQLMLVKALRKPKNILYLQALAKPIKVIYERFLLMRDDHLYRLSINSQTVYLEKSLNDRFDNELRRIDIDDADWPEILYLFLYIEDKPVYIEETIYISSYNEYMQDFIDAIVYVPSALDYDRDEMKALINEYKLMSITYDIVEF